MINGYDTIKYAPSHITADLYHFMQNNFCFSEIDFQVQPQYINSREFAITVRRIDRDTGWEEPLQILVVDAITNISQIVIIDPSITNESSKIIHIERNIIPSTIPIVWLQIYSLPTSIPIIRIGREEFNTRFSSDIVLLPSNLYATGLDNGNIYLYNENYNHYYNIIRVITHIMQVALTMTFYRKLFFIISSCDGYMEEMFWEKNRCRPRIITDQECKDLYLYNREASNEYAVYYSQRYIVGMSTHAKMPYVLDVVDKHYFFHNMYNSFRSFHCGIPFREKQSKIVYAGQSSRGNKNNFVSRRDIDINPRIYFMSDAVLKTNIVCGGWIDREDMIHYKYILDIPGNGATWDGTAWRLNSGSVIFRSATGWRQWFHDDMVAGEHYVEIRDDFEDLDEKFMWCEAHPQECERMVMNCLRLFQDTYRFHNVAAHTCRILDKIINGNNL